MRYAILIICFYLLVAPEVPAQSIGTYLGDEHILTLQTKQVNQFFRRFNAEEGTDGTRYYPDDLLYRDESLREKYLHILFDEENTQMTRELKSSFINDVLQKDHSLYLDFHGGDWFAEVTAKFIYNGVEKPLTLFLKLQEEEVGSKWVIINVYFEPFHSLFTHDEPSEMKFLHPLSHELDFMNLIHVFKEKEFVELYTYRDYKPDYLTLFIYEVKRSTLTFKTIQKVKFHFLQIPGWYFELLDFNRPGYNSGWLISNLIKISDEEKEMLLNYIYHE